MAPEVAAETSISWKSHPAKESPWKTLVALLVILASGVVATTFMNSAGFGALASIIMFFSLSKFFFPTTYTLNSNGVTVKTTTQTFTREWGRFNSFYADRYGVLLSPFARPSRLESFRGLYITFGANRNDVVAYITAHVKAPIAPSAPIEARQSLEKT